MKAVITRLQDGGKQTLGEFNIYDGVKKLFSCMTLEPPDKDNQKNISCIPRGTYLVKRYKSKRFGIAFKLQHVPKRSAIVIHGGNFFDDTKGCIVVGKYFFDLNKDGLLDVADSRNTMDYLRNILPSVFYLQII